MNDPFDLQRFVDAQRDSYEQALQELRAGRKRTHWMWYVFPQLHGLGRSAMAQRYAISGRDEALAYLQHPCSGPACRPAPRQCSNTGPPARTGFWCSPDDLKFHSCMTLFARTAQQPALFEDALQAFFDGQPDRLTLERLDGG